MPRIAGIDIPNEKRVDIALTYIFGIGEHVANNILKQAKIDPSIRAKNLNAEEVKALQDLIEVIPTEGELRKSVRENIETLRHIQSYRGMRHSMGLPARGQRTRTNARTRKGKRKTIGSLTKEAAAKLESKPAAK